MKMPMTLDESLAMLREMKDDVHYTMEECGALSHAWIATIHVYAGLTEAARIPETFRKMEAGDSMADLRQAFEGGMPGIELKESLIESVPRVLQKCPMLLAGYELAIHVGARRLAKADWYFHHVIGVAEAMQSFQLGMFLLCNNLEKTDENIGRDRKEDSGSDRG